MNLENCESIIRESIDTYLNYHHGECVLKSEVNKPHLRQKYCECLQLEKFVQFTCTCLELVNTTVLVRDTYQQSHKLHLEYWRMFNDLPQPKDEMVSFMLIAVWFLIHSTIFKLQTPEERNKIDQRFLFNSYHVLLYYINGLYVSDEFVQQQVDIYLNSRYLDYRLNSFQKKNLKKQQNLFPNVELIKRKQKRSEPLFIESAMTDRQDGRFPNSIKFNLNQLSPSINSLLNLSQQKTKLVTHQIISHIKTNPLKIDQKRTISTQVKESRDSEKGQRLLDKYRVTQPPLEYFKKNPKVDHLFKDMLEMKLILEQCHQHIQTQPRFVKEDSNVLRERLTQYLEERALKQNLDEQNYGSMMITYQHARTPSDRVESHAQSISSFPGSGTLSPQPKHINKFNEQRKLYTDRYNKSKN